MDETLYIRGRRVVFERRDPVETLRYSLDASIPTSAFACARRAA